MKTKFKFTRDIDDSYKQYEDKEYDFLPRIGDCVHINGFYHRVVDVVWDSCTETIDVYLGQSAQSPEESKQQGYL